MPELKRLFLKGRMNKDLDERLVPNGEYRDALNIQISSSEGSDVGAIENILGNKVAKLKKAIPEVEWALDSATTNYYGLPLDAECIGAFKDDINDRIFWFITSSTVDCIAEYTNKYGVVRPALVDTQNILKFSKNNLITGINLIDDYLFFTDNNSEPKKVDVGIGKFSTASFTVHSQYKGRNFIESDITVIKKSPKTPPSMELFNSERDINGITNIETRANLNFSNSITGQLDDKAIKDSLPVTLEVLEINDPIIWPPIAQTTYPLVTFDDVAYTVGDKIILEADAPVTDLVNDSYYVKIEIWTKTNSSNYTYIVRAISPQVPDDDDFTWSLSLEQEKYPFEKKFPRFAYRWQYDDNQYSCFSPFTEVAFLPTIFKYNKQKGYNEGMVNTTRLITLNNFETPPVDVKKIEIVYKETNNPTIYVVDDITPEDISANNWEGFDITNNILYEVVPSNQLLRPWDNVPRLAKAQEIVGNRIVYGNYLQNYTLTTPKPLISGKSIEVSTVDEARPLPSLKTNREYSVGVVFIDAYGRETPVFSNNKAGFKVPIAAASYSNRIIAKGLTAPPSGFSYYKYFVKDSSAQYYNLAVDRVFRSNDGLTAWLAFPSVERNKITIEDTLIFKKGHDKSEQIEEADNLYKVLAIENSAPADIRISKEILKTISVGFGENLGDTVNYGFLQLASTPAPGSTAFVIVSEDGGSGISDETLELLKPGAIIRFTNTPGSGFSSSNSKFYKIINIVSETTNNTIKIFVEKPFSNDVRFLYNDSDALITTTANLIEIHGEVDNENDIKFQGKFFVQVENNQTLRDNIFNSEQTTAVNGGKVFPFDNITLNPGPPPQVSSTGGAYIDSYEDSSFIYLQMWGGGIDVGRGGAVANYNGGNGHPKMPDWANAGSGPPAFGTNWQVIWERRTNRPTDGTLWSQLGAVGTKIKFSNHATEYIIKGAREWQVPDQNLTRLYTYYDKPLDTPVNPNFLGTAVNVIILDQVENSDVTTSNPAVFETEPKELADLNLYYEASQAYPISEYEDEKLLPWFNCFSFGNGVESDRARDEFNAPFIDKGTKASTILEEPYEEERRATGLIYSGIFNSNSGLNNLNQFIQAEKITKDLNPIYGSIQKLHTRDTNLVALCEDKCLRILANKDALFNADGNTNVTSNNNVLGQAVPFAGEFGISKNPESFASYGYRAYFSDKKRGVVLRLSMDGLTEISNKGMTDYFYDNLKAATTVLGSYDIYSDAYTLTLNNDTVCFKESSDGWPTRKSFIPEYGISLNSDYYTFKNGMIWTHDNQNRNTFYEGSTAKSSVKLIFNDNPSKIKNFKTISYEGDGGWIAPLIQTDQQDGAVTTFLDKENIYYNYIRGLGDTWNNNTQSGTLDLKQFAAQGIGNIVNSKNADNTGPYTGKTTFTVTVKNDPLN